MLARGRRPRVLMAVGPRAAQRMCRILNGWEIAQPDSLRTLAHELRWTRYDLVIVGQLFDDSRAIEAVRAALLHAPRVPLVCVRAAPFRSALGDAAIEAFHAAAEELGAECFIDVLRFPDDADGNARVRALIERLACLV
jgi:hypothetical protein